MKTDRIQMIAEKAQAYLVKAAVDSERGARDLAYRWQHILRVSHYGQQIAEAEGADVEQVIVGCLLHDIAHYEPGDYRDHGREGAKISRPILTEVGFPPEAVDAICYAIAIHVDGKAEFEHPDTQESAIVSDADNIDRFGALRVLQFCQPDIDDFEMLSSRVQERLKVLESYRDSRLMGTDAGHELFNRQLDMQITFYTNLLEQRKLTTEFSGEP